jgi:hypothetical protein
MRPKSALEAEAEPTVGDYTRAESLTFIERNHRTIKYADTAAATIV